MGTVGAQARRALLVLFLVAGVVAFLATLAPISLKELTIDPVSAGDLHPLTGLLSMVGIGLWFLGGGVALGAVVSSSDRDLRAISVPAMLFWAGVVSATLGLDDALLFHEELAPTYLGVPQNLVLLGILVGGLAFVARFAQLIVRTDVLLFGAAAIFLGGSIVMDVLNLFGWAEDVSKLLGIAFWAAWLGATAHHPASINAKVSGSTK